MTDIPRLPREFDTDRAREPVTEELSLACQWGRCQDCPDRDHHWLDDDGEAYCLCHCHIDVSTWPFDE